MREPPEDVADAEVLAEVRRTWSADADRVRYQPVGFGAHHWTAYAGDRPRLFVTYDCPNPTGPPRFLVDLEASYAGARALQEAGLEFVLAPLPASSTSVTVAFAGGALSCTPWRDGTTEETVDVAWTATALRRLHQCPPPPGIPHWRPKVGPDFAETTAALVARDTWGPGPYADSARADVRLHLRDIERWTSRYHHLGELARQRPWVAAHGEPHEANQLITPEGRLLVDWDTLRLAPPELDLRVLVDAGLAPEEAGAEPEMLELFDLEWRLDEISQYAAWFAAPHTGTLDDDIAIGGLREELTRP